MFSTHRFLPFRQMKLSSANTFTLEESKTYRLVMSSLPNDNILEQSKFKAFADDTINLTKQEDHDGPISLT